MGSAGQIAGIDLRSGQRQWDRNIGGSQTPWTAGRFLFIVTGNADVVAMVRDTGKVRWVTQLPHYKDEKKKTGAYSWHGPVLASDRLLVTGSNKTMVTVSPYTGALLSSVKLSAPAYLPPIVADNQVFVLTDDGKLTAYR
jgi:outer membrane protein assembly factor BamB